MTLFRSDQAAPLAAGHPFYLTIINTLSSQTKTLYDNSLAFPARAPPVIYLLGRNEQLPCSNAKVLGQCTARNVPVAVEVFRSGFPLGIAADSLLRTGGPCIPYMESKTEMPFHKRFLARASPHGTPPARTALHNT